MSPTDGSTSSVTKRRSASTTSRTALPDDLPLVLVTDGDPLRSPTTATSHPRSACVRPQTGRPVRPLHRGSRARGLAAAVYRASEGLDVVLVEGHAPGGQAGQSAAIENYLGFPKGLSGGTSRRGPWIKSALRGRGGLRTRGGRVRGRGPVRRRALRRRHQEPAAGVLVAVRSPYSTPRRRASAADRPRRMVRSERIAVRVGRR